MNIPAITLRPRAITDLAEIWNYIADDSEQRADGFIDLLDRKINTLARRPNIGRIRDELAEGLNCLGSNLYS